MKVCVLQPDYSQSAVDYKNYDPPRNLSHLLLEDQVDHVFLNKATTYRQLKELKNKDYNIFVNLCTGCLDWEVPSIDVIVALEQLNLPYTGPTFDLYEINKELMKYVAYVAGVRTPAFVKAETLADVESACENLQFPLFVKPAASSDSLGIDAQFYVTTKEGLYSKAADIIGKFGQVLIEEYAPGREFTVLVAANPENRSSPLTYKSLEFVFPDGEHFKTYELKVRRNRPEFYITCADPELDLRLRDAAAKIFCEYNGFGYACLDFRVNEQNEVFVLSINFKPSVFYSEGAEALADCILKFDGAGSSGFLKHIIAEGIDRQKRRQRKFRVRKNTISGYGIYAITDFKAGEIVVQFEEQAKRIVTRSHVESHWSISAQESFQRYALPLSEEVFIFWDEDPAKWLPTNHSCDANMVLRGLNICALRDIAAGEELTLDYSVSIYSEDFPEFECQCGSFKCRGIIRGTSGNSVTWREKERKKSQIRSQIQAGK
ncbi:SET domain-containing protein-lysine N-methyltransferase [Microcoleus sp. FACHB-831]|uniref:SET domain-containing protein-lysine N-methyltransferase n=1 Tax=Microcoleus sp. FACHB-831 TaxID=2692827 RepID=UPI00168849C9|nr:SET domain-containing protein-lysine N-methyltransferase [Microcoleus sp. FACHB-831]MBD1923177.1 SET domain-containing protein-lysine N-methyltransferase [Microcoleus sp. FACHB-831]